MEFGERITREWAIRTFLKPLDLDDNTKLCRVASILSFLTWNSSKGSNWHCLPVELINYLLEHSLNVERDEYSFKFWNMFGLYVGWQGICTRKPSNRLSAVTTLIDMERTDKSISHINICHQEGGINTVNIHYCDTSFKAISLDFALHKQIIAHVLNRGPYCVESKIYSFLKKSSRQTIFHSFNCNGNYNCFLNTFPELEKDFIINNDYNEEKADKDIEELRKYFELAFRLLYGA